MMIELQEEEVGMILDALGLLLEHDKRLGLLQKKPTNEQARIQQLLDRFISV